MKALNRLNEITDFESIRAEEWNYYPWKVLKIRNEKLGKLKALRFGNELKLEKALLEMNER